jgi:lipoate---protein ligase
MRLLNHTFSRPEENLACDEALLDLAVEVNGEEYLRIWESASLFVVVGYTNEVHREVNIAACTEAGIPILRRCSGGGTVLQGPGCLNYALILKTDRHPTLQTISGTNRMILDRHAGAFQSLLGVTPALQGHTDMVIDDRKFSGNAQRRKGAHVLFHGTLLYDFPLEKIGQFLPLPSITPEYRKGRSHASFVANIRASRQDLVALLQHTWEAYTVGRDLPFERVTALAREKYTTQDWTFRR